MPAIITSDLGPVRVLTLNRPEVRNALSVGLRDALSSELEHARSDASVRALVVTGSGSAFCAGADLAELAASSDRPSEEGLRDAESLARLLVDLHLFPKPVIAAVNGPAVAGGAGLVAACDLAVAAASARLGYTEVRIGFVPALVAVFLVRQVGDRRARDLLLSARLVPAEEARAMGLVNEVVPDEVVLDRALERAGALARNGAGALAQTKQLLAGIQGMGLEEALRHAARVNALARTTGETREGVRAFLEKREPSWKR